MSNTAFGLDRVGNLVQLVLTMSWKLTKSAPSGDSTWHPTNNISSVASFYNGLLRGTMLNPQRWLRIGPHLKLCRPESSRSSVHERGLNLRRPEGVTQILYQAQTRLWIASGLLKLRPVFLLWNWKTCGASQPIVAVSNVANTRATESTFTQACF